MNHVVVAHGMRLQTVPGYCSTVHRGSKYNT